MDDKDLFGTPTSQDQQNARIADAWHREQARKAHDMIRITNPLRVTVKGQEFDFPADVRKEMDPNFAPNGDFYVLWEGLRYRVPLNGNLEIDRYIAQKYCRDMCTAVINYYGKKSGEELLKREGNNRPEILTDKYFENEAVWNRVPRTDDQKLMAEIWPQLWVGLVRENGLDNFDSTTGPETDFRTPEEKLMEQLSNRRAPEIDTESTLEPEPVLDPNLTLSGTNIIPVEPGIYVSNAEKRRLAKEVTNDN